jgi:hypothetical protein
MTQAFNLSQFANNLNTSGQTSNSGLQNSSVTVTAGTGMSGGGAVALGSSVTLNNAGVTSVTAGTGISVSASTGGVTISSTGGGVTSITAGNGISINASTGAVTVTNSLYAPAYNSVGSYLMGTPVRRNSALTAGLSMSVGTGDNQFQTTSNTFFLDPTGSGYQGLFCENPLGGTSGISGTWRSMNYNASASGQYLVCWCLAVRIA